MNSSVVGMHVILKVALLWLETQFFLLCAVKFSLSVGKKDPNVVQFTQMLITLKTAQTFIRDSTNLGWY